MSDPFWAHPSKKYITILTTMTDPVEYRLPVRIAASHTRLATLYSVLGVQCPYCCENLLIPDLSATWNAGRFAPVSLTVDLGHPKKVLGLNLVPDMRPEIGQVELVIHMAGLSISHISTWRDGEPVSVVLSKPIQNVQLIGIVFMRSPSWIALRRFEACVAIL